MKTILKVMTCGSVDDGKSTLMGRLLFDAGLILKDQAGQAITHQGETDYSLFFDGLSAEQEQNITIDVSYKYFYLNNQKIIIADCPGHVEFIRNMATAASHSDVAVLVIDVTKGITEQTYRHLEILKFFKLAKLVVAINKMDLVNYQESVYKKIILELQKSISAADFDQIHYVPVSALSGEGLCAKSVKMNEFSKSSLLDIIFQPVNRVAPEGKLVLSVQGIQFHQGRRYLQVQKISGQLQSSVQLKKVGLDSFVSIDLEIDGAFDESSNVLTMLLKSDVEISRGDVLAAEENLVTVAKSFDAELICLQKINPHQNYLVKIGFQQTEASFDQIQLSARPHSVVCQASGFFHQNLMVQTAGVLSQILVIDRMNYQTVAVGFVRNGQLNQQHKHFEPVDLNLRQKRNSHKSPVIWLSGLSGAGKTTLAERLEKQLFTNNFQVYLLDADRVRAGLNKDLDFSIQARDENIRRLAETAKILSDSGQITIVTAITPLESQREMVKKIVGEHFFHIHLSTPLEVCEQRDVKGLYQKARAGLIPNMTGISSPFERSLGCHLELDTSQIKIDDAVCLIYQKISRIF